MSTRQYSDRKHNYALGSQHVGGDADVESDSFAGVGYEVGVAANSVRVLQGSDVKHAIWFGRSTTGWWRC